MGGTSHLCEGPNNPPHGGDPKRLHYGAGTFQINEGVVTGEWWWGQRTHKHETPGCAESNALRDVGSGCEHLVSQLLNGKEFVVWGVCVCLGGW